MSIFKKAKNKIVEQNPIKSSSKILKEFREFAIRGNVVDLAVGVIIGTAFGKIVDSMVSDLIMPIVGLIVGKLDFSNLFLVLGHMPEGTIRTLDALRKAGVPVFAYGSFITILVNFIILAFVIFVMVKQINRIRAQILAQEEQDLKKAKPKVSEEILLLREINQHLAKLSSQTTKEKLAK